MSLRSLLVAVLWLLTTQAAVSQQAQLEPPESANFYSMQFTSWPPFPGNVLNLPVFPLDDTGLRWLMDDRNVKYAQLNTEAEILAAFELALSPNGPLADGFNSSCICATELRLLPPVIEGSNAVLTVASSDTNGVYDLFMTTNLNQKIWTLVARGAPSQTQFVVTNVPPSESYCSP